MPPMPPLPFLARRRSLTRLLGGAWSLSGLASAAKGAAPTAGPVDAARSSMEDPVRRGRALVFPRDHGAHPASRIEWWYATGWLETAARSTPLGFQVTFFRSRTGLDGPPEGRLVPRQLLFAHAAVTDVTRRSHHHADRIARWSGQDTPGLTARAARHDADVQMGRWRFRRSDAGSASRYDTQIQASDFEIDLALTTTQPLLLQGDNGFSRKGPEERQASHYVSEPQLAAQGRIRVAGETLAVKGRAWIDHEWSEELLHPQAVGWDWIGINLDDGRALTAFQLRRADGSALWAGGSLRAPGQPAQNFSAQGLRFVPGRRWRSPSSNADYPVDWTVHTPAGRFSVHALLDSQELDGRASTGAVYWEGLSEVRDEGGRRAGLGYLEMTGYAGRLQL